MGMPRNAIGWAKSDDPRTRKTRGGEFAYGSYCISWINVIQPQDFDDGAYNGKTVTPNDAAKVLVRIGNSKAEITGSSSAISPRRPSHRLASASSSPADTLPRRRFHTGGTLAPPAS